MPESMRQNPERLGRDTIETKADVEGNHSNFEQNLAEKQQFVIWKMSEK